MRDGNNGTFATGMFPVYYIPSQQQELPDVKVPPCYQGKVFFLNNYRENI